MKWFGRSKNDKKQPLIQELNTLGKDGEAAPAQEPPVNEVVADNEQPTPVDAVLSDLDKHIPAKRVTSGEREMILPKHMQAKLDKEEDLLTNGEKKSTPYIPLNEVHTRSQDDSHSTAVISAISLSTIGASIEREVEAAKNNTSAPPLEIKAKKQEVKKKVEERFPIIQNLPDQVIDVLAAAYDYLHPKPKTKSIDDVPVTARKYRRDHPDLLLPGNTPRVGFSAWVTGFPLWAKFLVAGAVAAVVIAKITSELKETMVGEHYFDWQEETFVDWNEEKSIAFLGNSYMFVNDVPRLVEKISRGKIHQDSCLNPSASLGKLLRAGNGMYEIWQTENALTYKFETYWSDGGDEVYDWGMCSVFQLLEGYDNDLTYRNYNGAYYYEEGTNPCFEDENYILYLNDRNLKHPEYFDYVVINDQTRRMANADAREDSVDALKYAYAPMIAESRAVPLIVDTHAYPEEPGSNATTIYSDYVEDDDYYRSIPFMQAMIYVGVEEYMSALKYNLPSYQAPKVVPIGMAYTVVWDEDYELWQKLFLNETAPIASPHGSYLFANVIYATVYGHLPARPTNQKEIRNYFSSARYLPDIPRDYTEVFPTMEESDYLRLVARRVALQGYTPQVYIDAREQIQQQRASKRAEECACEREGEGEEEMEEEGEENRDCVCDEDVDMDEGEYRRS